MKEPVQIGRTAQAYFTYLTVSRNKRVQLHLYIVSMYQELCAKTCTPDMRIVTEDITISHKRQ